MTIYDTHSVPFQNTVFSMVICFGTAFPNGPNSSSLRIPSSASHRGLRWPRRLGHSGDSSKNRTTGELTQEAQHLDAMMTQSISHDGSMVLLYMVTWIPSIYPSHVSIYTSTSRIRHGNGPRRAIEVNRQRGARNWGGLSLGRVRGDKIWAGW